MNAELVVLADQIETMAGGPPVNAIATAGGVVTALGTRSDARGWIGPNSEVLDLTGSTVLPGLTDCHSHPVMGAALTAGISFEGVRTVAAMRDILAAESLQLGPEEWVLGWGLQPDVFGETAAHRELIDDVVAGRPTLLRTFDGHSALASTAALQASGISSGTSSIVTDEIGQPTGFLLELDAVERVVQVLPETSRNQQVQRVLSVLRAMAANGITTVHAMDFGAGSNEVFGAIEAGNDLPVRILCFPWITPTMEQTEWVEIADSIDRGGRRWAVQGTKFFIDGTIDNGTAWLSRPDSHGESLTSHWPSPDTYAKAISYMHARGIQTATHAIGDRAVEFALESLDRAGAQRGTVRHRLEHLETVSDSAVELMSRLGVVASMQPTHCTDYVADDGSDNWSTRLGPGRASNGWRCADIDAAGIPLVLGSDWPIAGFDPRHIIAAAQSRRPQADRHPGPSQALGARSTIRGLTSTAAWVAGAEDRAGTISIGKRADFSAFSMNPLSVPPDEFEAALVVATVLDGTVTYRGASIR